MSPLSSLSVTTWATHCSEAHHVKEIPSLMPQRRAQVCNPRIWEMGAYGLRVQGHTWQGAGRDKKEERREEGRRKEKEKERDDVADGSSSSRAEGAGEMSGP